MAEVDSLEIKIQSDAEKASQSIDKLVKKLDSVAKSLGSINTSAMSASINELTGKLSSINGKGFIDLNKSAKEAGGSVAKISETAKRVSKSLSEIQGKYADLGKGFEIKGSTQQIQKQIDNLTNQLAKAKLAKEDFEASGRTNLGGYETAVKNVIKYTNQIESLRNKLAGLQVNPTNIESFKEKNPNFRIKKDEAGQKFIVEYKKELLSLQKTVEQIGKGYGGIENASKGTFDIQIGNLGKYIEEIKESFPQATNVISAFEKELQRLQGVSSKLTKEPIRPKIETNQLDGKIKETAQKTDSLGNRVEALKAKLKELSGQGLNFGDAKFDETYRKLNQASEELKKHKSNLEQTGNSGKSFSERLKNALANVSSQTTKTSVSIGKLASSIKRALYSVKQSSDGFGGFAKKIGLLYAKLYVLRRGFNALFGTVKSSMDYIETLNYFNAAFEQIAKKADLKSFKKMGYDSAEAYYNSFSERAEQLTQKMSGFKIDESGMAVSTGEKSLGIDPGLLMQNQAMFGQMANSMGIVSETAGKLSSVFTRLGSDIASLKNEDFQKVWQNMASGMTGMSRAVDKYGMNIREANLQQTLNNIGIDKSISKLTQQEKVLLRTIVMLDSSRAAWGDLAKTMNQPANQLRLLQSNWSNLSRTIGNIFLPVVAKVLPYLNAITIVLQRFAEQIVKLLGFEDFDWGGLGATGGADFDIDFGDAEDNTAGMADNMDKTAKKVKKAVDNLQGFDIINKLQDPNADKDSDKDKGKGLSPSEAGKLNSALDKLLNDYDKAWNKAFKGMENKANQLANKMQKALVNAWNKGDFSELGKKVAAWINKGLAKIPWSKIKENVKKIARSIATFLNGFIDELDWTLVGKTIAEGLNTAVDGAYEFWTTFDWLKFGTSLAECVNSFIDNFDAEKFGKLLGAKLRGVIQLAFGFVTNLNFEKLGEKIGDAINGFLEDMGKVDKRTGLTGWQELGRSISTSITGVLDTINTALETVKWGEVGKAISGFLTSIDWWGILNSLATTLGTVLKSVVTTAISAIAEDPAGMIKALSGIFAIVFAAKQIKSIIDVFKPSMATQIGGAVSQAISGAGQGAGIGGAIGSLAKLIGTTFKSSMKVSIAKAMAGTGISSTIFRGLSSAFSVVSGKVAALGATLKTALTSEAFLASFGPVAIAVAGAIVSGKLIANRINEAIDAINFTGDYEIKIPEKMKENAQKAQESLENTRKSAEETKKSIDEINKSVQTTDGKSVKDLADKYYELSQKANPTATDIAVMKKYSEELSEQIPGLSKNINRQTGAFEGSKEKLDGMINSIQRAARAQAAYNSSVELYEKQQENKKAIEEKEKVLKKYEEEFEAVKKVTEAVKKRSGVDSEEYKAQIKVLGTYANKVNATRAEINTLKGSQKEIASQIKKNNTIMNNAKVSTDNYAKTNKTLKEKMDGLNVSSKSQKDVIKKLNEAVDTGEISWKDYKEIVDGNYTSVDELNGAIEKLSPKSVEIKATTSGKDGVDELEGAVSSIKDKSVTITANAETTDAKYKINDLTTGKKVTITASLGNTKELTEKIKNELKSTPFKMTAAQIFPNKEQIAEYFKKITESKAWKNVMTFTPTPGKQVQVDDKNKSVKIPKDADFGGILSRPYAAMGYKINYYAVGGFPNQGQLFVANEKGAELVGNMNGRTTVAPQNDIAEGFAQAITNTLAPVMYSAFKQAATETAQISGGDVYLDGMKITENVIGHTNQISKSRGRSPFWGVN